MRSWVSISRAFWRSEADMAKEEPKLVVWKDDGKWYWHIEADRKKIRGRNVEGVADTFKEAYDAAKKRLNREVRKNDKED